jgi:hypothetical protein
MANRRKFIAGLGALATGSAAAMGTGAFTSVSAGRSLNVEVSEDSSALLAIEPGDGPNGDYVTQSGDTVSIDIATDTDGDGNQDGLGLNEDATTIIKDLFRVTNQGTQDVGVWVSGVPEGIVFSSNGDFANSDSMYNGFGANSNEFTQYRHFSDGDFKGGNGDPGVAVLKPGQTVKVELFRPGYGNPSDVDFSGSITVNAEDTDNL